MRTATNNGNNQATPTWLNSIAKEKTILLQEIFAMEPLHVDVKDPITKKLRPRCQGEDLVRVWDECYAKDPRMTSIVVDTVIGPSTPHRDYCDGEDEDAVNANPNPAMPYQQLRALVGDGGEWKWPEIWKNLDTLPRRGLAWRGIDDPANLGRIENPNPDIVPLNCLVVGSGPVGLRLAIELILGGHRVTLFEKRREVRDPSTGALVSAGFTNRVNRPHIKNFCRNDLDRLNGRNFMTPKMCYPVFTNDHTSSIGIDECQMMLLKTALLLGVRFELGVGYVDAEIDVVDQRTQRPTWNVEYKADAIACERYNKQPSGGTQRFDALFGCDGGNSGVRKSQQEWLGQPKTRKYKKMYGIVTNLRKCSRTKLKELGFEAGLEPDDKAGTLTGVYFYKASYHNYLVVHPSVDEMRANGIPWKGIFGFEEAREGAISGDTANLKSTLKTYMAKKAKALRIPFDESLPNGGFVDAPNDVMGFDFSEFYNCEKPASCCVPPLDWDSSRDGEWEIHCPLIALAGDSVADPNWLLGVGLQRGWNSALDACFYADNVYNNKSFNGRPPSVNDGIPPRSNSVVEWSEHLDNLGNLMANLGKYSRDGKLSSEMSTGILDEKGPVVKQIDSLLWSSDVSIPQYLPMVEPWYRYQEYESAIRQNYKGEHLVKNIHPTTTREVAIIKHNETFLSRRILANMICRPTRAMLTWSKRFECSAFWCNMSMKLLKIDGKAAPGTRTCFGSIPEWKNKTGTAMVHPTATATAIATIAATTRAADKKKKRKEKQEVLEATVANDERSKMDATKVPSQNSRKSIAAMNRFFSDTYKKDRSPPGGRKDKILPPPNETVAVEVAPRILASKSSDSTLENDCSTPPLTSVDDVSLVAIRCEQELCKARLAVAQAEVAEARVNEETIRAKRACAEKEVELFEDLLAVYASMELKLQLRT